MPRGNAWDPVYPVACASGGTASSPCSAKVAEVVLDIPTRAIDSTYSYLVPDGLEVCVGECVEVEFSHRPSVGYVMEVSDRPSEGFGTVSLLPIRRVLSEPYFDGVSAELARWIAHEYLSTLPEAVRLLMPPGASPKFRSLGNGQWEYVPPAVGSVDDRWVSLTDAGREYEPRRNATKQIAVIDALREGEVRVAELGIEIDNVSATLRSMEQRGLVKIENRRRMRGVKRSTVSSADIEDLTQGQRDALAAIDGARAAADGSVVLLDGVTGSGKTEVYLQAIRKVLDEGRSACVLVPEISLTPQTVGRFRSRFGDQVAVLHSRLSVGERYDQWSLVRSGAARVVVGARSALFAPLSDLGLIVIDEEHESSYKQGSSPRYSTRDVAVKLAELRGAALVLGSASPAIETLARCRDGDWRRVVLDERASGQPLPPVQVVDLSREFEDGNRSMYSRELADALRQTIDRGEKAVLLLNRRGFASFLLCRECGYVPTCEQCSTSLAYHEGRKGSGEVGYLMCHHCGRRYPVPARCPECGSPYLRQLGPGTQFASDQLRSIVGPGTTIVRMDADTTRNKGDHERLLGEFAAADSGVLLGTQMIAKGLDFPDVTLAGVLIADTTLKLPDFRAAERTFQLVEQVSGRAGRAEKSGRVIVQTYWPDHPAIVAASKHDRELFLESELPLREQLGYPPYTRLANILIWGKNEHAVAREAENLRKQLDDHFSRMTGRGTLFYQVGGDDAPDTGAAPGGRSGDMSGSRSDGGDAHDGEGPGKVAPANSRSDSLRHRLPTIEPEGLGRAPDARKHEDGAGGGSGSGSRARDRGSNGGKTLPDLGGIPAVGVPCDGSMPEGWSILGPSPCLLSKLRGTYRWHILVKAPAGADISSAIEPVLRQRRPSPDTSVAVDVDPMDLF